MSAQEKALGKPQDRIRLVGDDDSPMPEIEYQVVLPNGDFVRGFLDDNGCGRVESIASADECQ